MATSKGASEALTITNGLNSAARPGGTFNWDYLFSLFFSAMSFIIMSRIPRVNDSI